MSYDTRKSLIWPVDEQYVTGRGVPVSVALDAGLFSADDLRAAQELGYDRPLEGGALVIPYFDAAGKRVAVRARLHTPPPDGPKFLTPAKTEVRPYFPPSAVVDSALWQASVPIVEVEGAIKALCVSANGIPTIGLGGVLAGGHDAKAWRERKEPLPHADIAQRVQLKGRKVTIAFDAGRVSNPMVALGEGLNAAALEAHGADVWVAALPFRSDGGDQGPDDFLHERGVDALWEVLDAAQPANPVKRVQLLGALPEKERQESARVLVTELPFLAALHVGGDQLIDAVNGELIKLGLRVKTDLTKRLRGFRDQLRAKVAPKHRKTNPQGRGRPQICISTEEMEIVNEAEAALADDLEVYKRGNALVRVTSDGQGPRFLLREPGAPRVEVLPGPTLEERLSAHAEWMRENDKGEWIPARPPTWAVNALANRPDWPNIRPLEGVAESPVFRRDGRVVWESGYDADTGLLLKLVGDIADIPDQPTLADAQAASDLLLSVVVDFPFASEEHRAAWLAALLTPFSMFAYTGCSPLVVIDANIRGSGKTLLVEVLGIIATGRGVPRMANTVDDSEMRKRLLGLALAAPQIVLIDNIDGRFGTPSLDMAITAGSVSDRVLGLSKIVTVPLRPLWLGTGNNVQLVGDMARRVLHIRLESPLEKPEERSGFQHGNLVAWVREERPRLVAAALTILRAYHLAGRPAPKARPWGSFEAWQALVCGAITWLGLPEPSETRVGLNSSDSEGGLVAALIAGWAELDPTGQGVTAAEAIRSLEIEPMKFNTLRDALSELVPAKSAAGPDARALGYALRKFKGRVVGNRKLELRTGHQSTAKWFVVNLGGPAPSGGGDGGHGGDVLRSVPFEEEIASGPQGSLFSGGPAAESPPSPPSPPPLDESDEDIPF